MTVDSDNTQQRIRQLEQLRFQKRLWQYGVFLVLVVLVVICIVRLRNAFTALTTQGAEQTRFVTELNSRLQQNVLPSIEELGTQTLHEINFGGEVQKLNRRTPELVQASLQQLKLLNTNLTRRGQAVLNTTLQSALKERESKIRALFPDLTDDQVASLMTNLAAEAKEQVGNVSADLFAPHQKALNNIVQDMTLIQHSEPVDSKTEPATWEMGLLIFDIARADLKDLETPPAEKPASKSQEKGNNI
jgi:uncharacterized phage infection (PIP) family protein YhgE